jgi:hypothetical protein
MRAEERMFRVCHFDFADAARRAGFAIIPDIYRKTESPVFSLCLATTE